MARDEQIRVDLVAKDDASKVIGKVADAAEDLEKISPEIEITADADAAKGEIDALGDDVRKLQQADAEIVLRAKVDAAKGELRTLQAELDQTGDRAAQTARQLDRIDGDGGGGIKTRGNAISDLTGPLGEASGAASDFAGVFDGLGDIVEDAAAKMGASAGQAAAISGAVGGIGIAVAGAAALWSLYTSRQEAARKKQDELIAGQRKLNDALAEGNTRAAATELLDLYDDLYVKSRRAGVGADEVTKFLTGQSDVIPTLEARLRNLNAEQARNGDASAATNQRYDEARLKLIELMTALNTARTGYTDTNGTLVEQEARLNAVTAALGGTTSAQDDATLAALAGGRATGDVARQTNKATDATDRHTEALGRNRSKLDSVRTGLDNIRLGLDMERSIEDFRVQIDEALKTAGTRAGLTRDDIRSIQDSILQVARTAKATPIEVETALDALKEGDLNAVRLYGEAWYRRNPVNVASVIRPPSQGVGSAGGGGIPIGRAAPPDGPSAAPTVTVHQYVPRGYRGDLLADARSAARRTGRLYQRNGR